AVNDMGEGKTLEWWDDWLAKMKAKHGNGNGHGKSLAIEAMKLLPTPRSQNGDARNDRVWHRPDGQPQNLENALWHAPVSHLLPTPTTRDDKGPNQRNDTSCLHGAVTQDWGVYGPAI